MGAADKAPVQPNATAATNLADQITNEMRDNYKMVFNGEPTIDDIAIYTHGMIQAIYKAYALGPSCTPYEIAVGDLTKKMASCLPCTLFMVAAGYPPNSTHLGRGESWAPLYETYNPGGHAEPNERAVIRDLNNAGSSSPLDYRFSMTAMSRRTTGSAGMPLTTIWPPTRVMALSPPSSFWTRSRCTTLKPIESTEP